LNLMSIGTKEMPFVCLITILSGYRKDARRSWSVLSLTAFKRSSVMSASENRWRIIALEIMPDHVHMFLNVKATDSPADIMRKVKGRASHHLRQEFPELLKIPTLWTPSYFVSKAGNVATETVKNYIGRQRD
jgi:REP element-mobilizing transposase RayT